MTDRELMAIEDVLWTIYEWKCEGITPYTILKQLGRNGRPANWGRVAELLVEKLMKDEERQEFRQAA